MIEKVYIERIKTYLYVLQRILIFLMFILFLILYILFIPGKYNSKPVIDEYHFPKWVYLLGYISFIINFLSLFIVIALNKYVVGKIVFSKDSITINGDLYLIKNINEVNILFNPLKYKSKEKRPLLNGGGNNWIIFEYRGKKKKVEFMLNSVEEENNVRYFIFLWESITKIEYGISKNTPIMNLFDRECYYN